MANAGHVVGPDAHIVARVRGSGLNKSPPSSTYVGARLYEISKR